MASALIRALESVTGLPQSRVKNAFSSRGADLVKWIEGVISTSIDLDDSFIVFDVEESKKDYYVLHEDDDTDSLIANYTMFISIYGNNCSNLARKILIRFKDENLLRTLYNKGVFVGDISRPDDASEFINNTLWRRVDLSIDVKIRYNEPSYSDNKIIDSGKTEIIKIE